MPFFHTIVSSTLLLLSVWVKCNKIVPDFTAEVIVSAVETVEWWEMQQLDDPLFDEFRTSKIMMRSIDMDENKIHSCYEYRVVNEEEVVTHTDTFCFPSVIITGYRKSSTSALYNLLAQYPQAKLSPMKENCAFLGDRSIVQYFDSLPRSIEPGEIIFDGCVDLKGNIKMRNLLRGPNSYYLVLVRDFANWLWSAYNYWCQPEYDEGCFIGDHWTTPDLHHRSPETFHDIVMGSINGTYVPSPLLFKQPCEEAKVLFQRYIAKLWTCMPIENTIILASEDLESKPEYVWSRISASIGLNAQHPKLKAFTEVRYNTQGTARNTKGADVTVSADKYKPGLYGVSKFQPMLESTRRVLNQCWKDDCIWSSLVTGHKYAACHTAENSQREYTNYITADPVLNQTLYELYTREEATELQRNMTVHLRHYFDFQKAYQEMPKPFLQMPTIRCEENFNHTILLTKNQNSISMRLKTASSGGTGGGSAAAAARRMLTSSSTPPSVKVKKPREGILVLSSYPGDRAFLRNLVYFSTGLEEFIDVSDQGIVEGHVPAVVPVLGLNGLERCSVINNQTDRKMMVGTDPKNVRVVLRSGVPAAAATAGSGSDSKYVYVFKSLVKDAAPGPTNCDLGLTHYDYVIYIVRDSLAAAWTAFQRSQGLKGERGEQLIHFNWDLWEEAAVTMLRNISSNAVQTADINESTDIVYKIDAANKMIFRIEDLMFSHGKMNLLKMLVEFPKKMTAKQQFALRPDQRANTIDGLAAKNKLLQNLNCAHLLSAKRQSHREAFASRSNMDLAYASDDLLCKVKQIYEHQPLSLLSLHIDHNVTCVNGVNTVRNIQRKCKLRYERSTYLETPRMPPVLLTMSNHDAINTRLLLEHATGIYTGAMETNRFLTDLFPGEFFCGQRMIAIYAHARDVTIKNTKSGAGTVSLTNHGKKKCMKGSIRGFTHSLVIPRDPFMSVWREFHRQLEAEALASSSGLITTSSRKGKNKEGAGKYLHQYPADMKARLLNISSFFTVNKLEITHAYDRLHESNFDESQVLMVSFEALINPIAPTPVLHNTHHHIGKPDIAAALEAVSHSNVTAKFGILREILQFAKVENIFNERVECAYKFMEVDTALQELQRMNSFFLTHHHLVCEMNKIFSVVLAKNKFRFIRLFSDVDCGQKPQQQAQQSDTGWL